MSSLHACLTKSWNRTYVYDRDSCIRYRRSWQPYQKSLSAQACHRRHTICHNSDPIIRQLIQFACSVSNRGVQRQLFAMKIKRNTPFTPCEICEICKCLSHKLQFGGYHTPGETGYCSFSDDSLLGICTLLYHISIGSYLWQDPSIIRPKSQRSFWRKNNFGNPEYHKLVKMIVKRIKRPRYASAVQPCHPAMPPSEPGHPSMEVANIGS